MRIIRNSLEYIDQLVDVVEEYREFCGVPVSPKETKDFFQKRFENDESVTFIAIDETSNVLMGFANTYLSFSTLSLRRLVILNDLGVSKTFQGRGVAQSLVNEVIAYAKSLDSVRVELKTKKNNVNAQKLYQSLGFEPDNEHFYYQVPV